MIEFLLAVAVVAFVIGVPLWASGSIPPNPRPRPAATREDRVERAAAALWWHGGHRDIPWEQVPPADRREYRAEAEAVVDALFGGDHA